MTATSIPASARVSLDELRAGVRGRRRVVNGLATAALIGSFLTALIPLVLVVGYLISRGLGVISLDFLTSDIPRQARSIGPGMGPAIIGTLVITAAASMMAIPLGILGAIYLSEFGGKGVLARLIRFMADVMTGVPSIVMGLFIYTVWVERFHTQSGFAGALALGCLMLPIVLRTTDEMLKLVPNELRMGSLALGAKSLKTTVSVVVPTALPGIVSGAMLAVARAAGETAPVVLIIGITYSPNWSLGGDNTTLSAQIFKNASTPFVGAQDRAWGAALTLVAIVFVFTLIARFIASRFALKDARVSLADEPEGDLPMSLESATHAPDVDHAPTPIVQHHADPAPTELIFDVKGLNVYYGTFRAVRDVNLEIGAGEITAFIGPSGCGKSTVLRCLDRMNDLIEGARVEGQVLYQGVDLYGPGIQPVQVRRRIGMVFQKPNPFPKSIYDNVAYGPRVAGQRKNLDDTVEKALQGAALWDEVKDRLKKSALGLSGGQQQRLCIARAIAVEPEVLLMDEPCSALDPIATARIEDLMQEIKDRYTIVIVTHNMQQAARVSDRTAFFTTEVNSESDTRTGLLVEVDSTDRMFSNPTDERTENYVTGRFG